MINSFLAIFALATFVEGFVEYFISDPNKFQPWLKYVAAAIGIAVSIFYRLDVFALLGVTAAYPFVGYVITGLVIGRGSNYLNDLISKIGAFGTTTVTGDKTTTTVKT